LLIQLDTSLLVDALTGPRRSAPRLRRALQAGERLSISALVLFEWLRGPRGESELADQAALFRAAAAVPPGPLAAAVAAGVYRRVTGVRGRECDLAVAACALSNEAALWTLNVKDFTDIPGLTLFQPA